MPGKIVTSPENDSSIKKYYNNLGVYNYSLNSARHGNSAAHPLGIYQQAGYNVGDLVQLWIKDRGPPKPKDKYFRITDKYQTEELYPGVPLHFQGWRIIVKRI